MLSKEMLAVVTLQIHDERLLDERKAFWKSFNAFD